VNTQVAPDGYRRSVSFTPPERVPWSILGPEFISVWGRPGGKVQPEHMEITGQTGSGKSYAEATLLQQRAQYRGSSEILIATKEDDDTIPLLGWPIVDNWKDLQRYRQAIFWPQTDLQGDERERFHEEAIYELLTRMWHKDANTVIAFDEIGYVESLPGPRGRGKRLQKLIRQYWREARTLGITLIAMKQRPVGVVRDQHSESRWKIVFPPADRGDLERFAELLGAPRDWAPVLDDLDQEEHEFVLRNSFTREAYISWMDHELAPVPAQAHQPDRTAREYYYGRGKVA
jgi:hypothetical protein